MSLLARLITIALPLLFVVGPIQALPADSRPARTQAAQKALAWFRAQQQPDGAIGGLGTSCEITAVVAWAGEDPNGPAWTPGNRSLLDACAADVPIYLQSRDAGRMGKVLRAVIAAGADPHNFGGLDLITELEARYDPAIGLYHPTLLFRHNIAVLALAEAGRPLPDGILPAMLAQIRSDGGWSWMVDTNLQDAITSPADLDATARSLQVLQALGVDPGHPAVISGMKYIAARQLPDGGWGLGTGETNANSTALAIEGLLAAGWNPESPRFQPAGISPLTILLDHQEASGAFVYQHSNEGSLLLATIDAATALLHTYPDDIATPYHHFLPFIGAP